MCRSETVVCYGIVMRSWQLIVAAEAFPKFSPQLRGIDIIISRQRKGTLQVMEKIQGMRSISDMPLAVLDMIRGKVFSETELLKTANQILYYTMFIKDWRRIPPLHSCEGLKDMLDALSEVYLPANEVVSSFYNLPLLTTLKLTLP